MMCLDADGLNAGLVEVTWAVNLILRRSYEFTCDWIVDQGNWNDHSYSILWQTLKT